MLGVYGTELGTLEEESVSVYNLHKTSYIYTERGLRIPFLFDIINLDRRFRWITLRK